MSDDYSAPLAEFVEKRKHITHSRKWHYLRMTAQILAFLLFIYLLIAIRQAGNPLLHDIYFRLDPLVGFSAMIASRSWIPAMALGFIVLLLTLLVGRAWCGWLCPLGSILDWIPARRSRRSKLDPHQNWRQVKHFLLFIIFLSAIFGSLTLIFLDPITLLFRTISSVILPALDFVITTVETWLYNITSIQPAVAWFDDLLRGWLLNDLPFFLPNLALLVFFAGVLALNAIHPRLWCRYLCPLGGLLALVSKVPIFRYKIDDNKCISCQRCAITCPTAAISPEQKFAASSTECITCLDCVEICPTGAITFKAQWGLPQSLGFDPSRRQLLASLGAAAIGTAILRLIPVVDRPQPKLIRPPGASEQQLFNQCIRCGECIKVCPTGVIQPSSSVIEWETIWTPMLVTRLGYCDYSCNACGEVCPTGAITSLSLSKKRETVIGIARIDRERCIPWAEGRECIVCEEMCPIPQKAIHLNGQGKGYRGGQTGSVRLPRVREHLCTGCGICEYQCPVDGESAIRVFPINNK